MRKRYPGDAEILALLDFEPETWRASGFDGVAPEPLDEVEAKYYAWAWSLPAAAGWHWSDGEVVAEWARLKARVERGEGYRQTAGGTEKCVQETKGAIK